LDTAAAEIQQKSKVKTITVAADFGKADAALWAKIKAAVEPLQVHLLVDTKTLSQLCEVMQIAIILAVGT
jgi:hypothetical protein